MDTKPAGLKAFNTLVDQMPQMTILGMLNTNLTQADLLVREPFVGLLLFSVIIASI